MGYVHTLTGYIDNRKKSSHTEATVEVLMEQKSQNFVAGMGTYSTVFLSLVSVTWDQQFGKQNKHLVCCAIGATQQPPGTRHGWRSKDLVPQQA